MVDGQNVTIEENGSVLLEQKGAEEKPKENQLAEKELGSYVQYTPSRETTTIETSYNGYGNQNYDSSNYKGLWRILSKNGENVEIISDKTVANLTLTGTVGYRYGVSSLNKISQLFSNSSLAISTRSIGGNALNASEDVGNVKYPVSNQPPYSESYHVEDVTKMTEANVLAIGQEYWLASRYCYYDSTNWHENFVNLHWIQTNGSGRFTNMVSIFMLFE